MRSKILLAFSEGAFGQWLYNALCMDGHSVDFVQNMENAEKFLKVNMYSLYIVEVYMHGGAGLKLCRVIRKMSENPIMVISDCNDEEFMIKCFRMGVDEYVVKPFGRRLILEKVKVFLKRSINEESSAGYIYKMGSTVIDMESREVLCRGSRAALTKIEFNLLKILVKNSGRIVTRDTMLNEISEDGIEVREDNTLSVYMSRLREKLESVSGEKYFDTVRGMGYRLICHVQKEIKNDFNNFDDI